MAFQKDIFFAFLIKEGNGFWVDCYSDKKKVVTANGNYICSYDEKKNFLFVESTKENGFKYHFVDREVGTFFKEYYDRYFLNPENNTNCGSMAQYLYNQEYLGCENGEDFSAAEGMSLLTRDIKIKKGDKIGIIFAYERLFKSRAINPNLRKYFLRQRKSKNKIPFHENKGVINFNEMNILYKKGFFRNFHFMSCIGKDKNGKNIFLNQMGRESSCNPSFKISNFENIYDVYGYTPVCSLIKRKRHK